MISSFADNKAQGNFISFNGRVNTSIKKLSPILRPSEDFGEAIPRGEITNLALDTEVSLGVTDCPPGLPSLRPQVSRSESDHGRLRTAPPMALQEARVTKCKLSDMNKASSMKASKQPKKGRTNIIDDLFEGLD